MKCRWFLILACLFGITPAAALDQVTLQLKWTHCFQFAGYYAAQELGYYREAGLEVRFEEGAPGVDVVGKVLSDQAQFGVGTSGLLLERHAGKPVVVLAVIFQHSPQVLIARQETSTQSIHDLAGKRVMIELQAEEIVAYLKREGIPLNRITRIEHSFNIQDLIDRRVDALTAYVINEPYYLDKANLPYQIYTPRSTGIDFYADNLFTSEQELKHHSERVKAFRAASLRGWQYAMAHPETVIDWILARYNPDQHLSRDYLRFEASEMAALIRPDLVEVGYMSRGRWRHIADTYADIGMLPMDFPLGGFLYEPTPKADYHRLYPYLAAVLPIIGAISGIAFHIHRINRRLMHSIAESERAQSALRTLSTAIEQSPTSIVITDLNAAIQYVNPQFTRVTGYSAEEAIGQNPRVLNSGLTRQATFQDMWCHLAEGRPWSGELINRRKNGQIYWEEAHISPVRDAAGQIVQYVAVKLDITERKQIQDRIAHMAHHDALTNLPNRALFSDRLEQSLALARRNQTRLAVMFIDLDKFKPINDTYGHAVGDQLLVEVASRLPACLRASDTVGRIGGDEFVVLLSTINCPNDALRVAEKIRQELNQPFQLAGHSLSIGSSIGVAIAPEHGSDQTELCKNADIAMYRAKENGRDNVKLFQPGMRGAGG